MRLSRVSVRVLVVIALIVGSLFVLAEPSRATSVGDYVFGEGTCFEATNSTYLNVTLCSTEVVNLSLESIPRAVSFAITPLGSTPSSTQLTLTGLEPNRTYYRHQDGHLVETFIADSQGNHSFTQDISTYHYVFLSEEAYTKFIRDDATGGQCTLIGAWDPATRACTLTTDVNEMIVLDSSGITLDGAGHSVRGGFSFAILAVSRTQVTVKNVVATGSIGVLFAGVLSSAVVTSSLAGSEVGIELQNSDSIVLSGNVISGRPSGAIRLSGVTRSTLSGNTMTGAGVVFHGGAFLNFWNSHTIDASNTVNGKPVIYVKDAVGGTVPPGAGQVILANSQGVLVEGQDVSGGTVGILLGFSSGNTIRGNQALGSRVGIELERSHRNLITGNTVGGDIVGISLSFFGSALVSTDNTVTANTISGGFVGIQVTHGTPDTFSDNKITHNTVTGSRTGIGAHAPGTVVTDNTVSATVIGISGGGGGITVARNSVSTPGLGQAFGANSIGIVAFGVNALVANNLVSDAVFGIFAEAVESLAITENRITNVFDGITSGSTGVISRNIIFASRTGTQFGAFIGPTGSVTGSSFTSATISENEITMTEKPFSPATGIAIRNGRPGITVSGNTVSGNNVFGIWLDGSTGAVLAGNAMTGSGVFISSPVPSLVAHWNSHTIETSNTVNGKPVIYVRDAVGGTVQPGAGQVILANSQGVLVEGQDVSGGTVGILLGFSSGNTIRGNRAVGNRFGGAIVLDSSNSNLITANTVLGTGSTQGGTNSGIRITSSDSNHVSGNEVSETVLAITMFGNSGLVADNAVSANVIGLNVGGNGNLIARNSVSGSTSLGIGLGGPGNTVECNLLSRNNVGLNPGVLSPNTIFHNDFVENSVQLQGSLSSLLRHIWRNAANEGNFWSDYAGGDDGSGGRVAGDGIGDTNLPHQGVDFFPLMRPCSNSPPTISSFTTTGAPEGSPVLFDVSASDADGDTLTYCFDFEGDGTFDVCGPSSSATRTFPDDFLGLARVQVSDGKVAVEATTSVQVVNVPPAVAIESIEPSIVAVGTEVLFQGSFTDPGTADTHVAQWTFDGVALVGTVTESVGSGTVRDRFTFTTPGVYRVTLTVTDDDGDVGTANTLADLEALVVVYDPNAGFVTGGGWIDSPQGAYAPDPALAGKAVFGFVSKYQKGASIPTGETEFQFKVASLNFHSISYEWLVVSGARAQYKGSGTINGAGDFGFLLTVIDGQQPGGGGVDRFRIKIWDKATGQVLYDSQTGADDGDAPTAVVNGSIVIHKP
jgi:parallel beta-helix repeat protein